MTDLERLALLGDRQAQEECTRHGIVLPCPCCGGREIETKHACEDYWCECVKCGTAGGPHCRKSVAIAKWNTRKSPLIGGCASCTYWDDRTCECEAASDIEVAYHKYTDPDFFCGDYRPKED